MVNPSDEQMAYAKHLRTSAVSNANKFIQDTHLVLSLLSHPEGGYFSETDRDSLLVPNPFRGSDVHEHATAKPSGTADTIKPSVPTRKDQSETRNASTTIFYLLDPKSPVGVFHRNKGRTVHTHHRGRGIYVLIRADEVESHPGTKAQVEIFTVGPNLIADEKLQWIVEGGKFKASFLLPDKDCADSQGGLLISETVVPGFEFADHDFLTLEGMRELLTEENLEQLSWLLGKAERDKM